jgi:aspartate/tyrosine/aromatic aminotransferase
MIQKKLFPFFDAAYQGFGSGIEEDVEALRPFIDDGHEFLIAYSCSKNFSLYCERAGALFIFTKNEKIRSAILSSVRMISRALLSNPPAHGARIVSYILDTPPLYNSWKEELEMIRKRIQKMRSELVKMLGSDYHFIEKSAGLFCITGLLPEQTEILKKEYAIYMTRDGRINLAGLNEETVGVLVHAMQKKGLIGN